MSYQVLALKYRPQTFEDVVGQEHVTTTLTNAITADRVAHAILLTGPRGTGKTTIARILAKAMTCAEGPTPSPCNQCKICTDIINGHCADVFEIDGASNNSVEQIRDLRENVTYMPASARFKIYIIDEVHMLSTAAFNALLKTLEEPPEHVLFIFATTEVHKIPATILSRCQRHDLARIPLERISDHLAFLCKEEEFVVERESLELVALEADGSIRDALSLLDRILSASPDKSIQPEVVVESLGMSDRQLMFDLASAVLTKDGAALISLVQRVNDSGLDLKKFYADIIAHFRNLNIIKICGKDTPSLNLIDAERNRLADAVARLSSTYTGMLLQRLLDDENLVKYAAHTQTAVEMVLLKLIQVNPGADLEKIITKLDALARQIDAQPSSQTAPPGPQAVREEVPPVRTAHPAPVQTEPSQPVLPEPPMQNEYVPEPPPEPMPQEQLPPEPPPQTEPPIRPRTMDRQPLQPPQTQVPPVSAGRPIDPGPATGPDNLPPAPRGPVSWSEFLNILQGKLPSMFALLSRADVDTSPGDHVCATLSPRSDFEKKRIDSKNKALQALSMQFMKKSIKLNLTAPDKTAQPPGPSEGKIAEDKAKQAAARHPMVQEARRLFNGEIL